MIIYNDTIRQLEFVIPNRGPDDLQRYRKGLLRVLAEINIENCTSEMKDDLKAVYEILDFILSDS